MSFKKNNLILAIALALAILFVLPLTSATIAAVQPTTGSNQTANFVTNWTFVNVTDGVTDPISANSTFYWNGTGSWVAVTKSNFFCLTNSCNATLTISSMADGLGVLNFTAGNDTKVLGGTLSGAFRVDTTNPTVSVSRDASYTFEKGPVTLSWSSSDGGSGLSSTSVSLVSPDTTNCPTQTYTTSSGSDLLSGTDTACVGTYTATITGTDIAGNIGTSSVTFEIKKNAYIIQTDISAPQQKKNNQRNGLILVGILLFLAYLLRKK